MILVLLILLIVLGILGYLGYMFFMRMKNNMEMETTYPPFNTTTTNPPNETTMSNTTVTSETTTVGQTAGLPLPSYVNSLQTNNDIKNEVQALLTSKNYRQLGGNSTIAPKTVNIIASNGAKTGYIGKVSPNGNYTSDRDRGRTGDYKYLVNWSASPFRVCINTVNCVTSESVKVSNMDDVTIYAETDPVYLIDYISGT